PRAGWPWTVRGTVGRGVKLRARRGRAGAAPTPSGERLHQGRDALPPADAGGAEAVAAAPTAQLVKEVDGDPRAGRGERMGECDGPAVDVGALRVEAELPRHRRELRGERLVDLDEVHIVEGEPRLLQRLAA